MKKALSILIILLASGGYSQTNYFKSFDGTEITYTDEGFGKAVLLVHGFIGSGASWENTALKKDLLEKGYRVVVPDLRGNGSSGKPQEDSAYQDYAEVKDLKELMSHLNTKEYYAVGYSRGSIVLANLLTKEPRIKRAVLGGMGLDFTKKDWDRRIMFMEAFAGNTTDETQGAVDYANSRGADLRSLHLQQKYQPVTSTDELEKVKAKILVVAGDEDLDNGEPQLLHEVFKKSKLVIVPGNHNDTYKTDEFSKVVLSFL